MDARSCTVNKFWPRLHFWKAGQTLKSPGLKRCLLKTNAPFPQHIENRLELWPTELNINRIIYSSRTIYLPSLKLLEQSVLELSVAQGVGDQQDLWPTGPNINWDHLLIMDYLTTKFGAPMAKRGLESVAQGVGDRHDLDLLTWISIRTVYWPEYQLGSSTHQGLIVSTYPV